MPKQEGLDKSSGDYALNHSIALPLMGGGQSLWAVNARLRHKAAKGIIPEGGESNETFFRGTVNRYLHAGHHKERFVRVHCTTLYSSTEEE